MKICWFRGEYRFLSNFYPCRIEYEGLVYPSVENAYQATKAQDAEDRTPFTRYTPSVAKRAGRRLKLRSDWEVVRVVTMYDLLEIKFEDSDLKRQLLATGDATLIEGNTWNDRYWGAVCEAGQWEGANLLGHLLMCVRGKARNNPPKDARPPSS
jgi:ribA/ribD-fused uncharacterized protein